MSEWDWQDQAACRADLGFLDRLLVEQAPVCRGCPVRSECLEYGVEQASSNRGASVMFGGKSAEQLLAIARARQVPKPTRRLTCVTCGGDFEATCATTRYCSKECRKVAYRDRRRLVVVQ